MFRGIQLIPPDTKIGFVRLRTISWVVSALLTVVPLFLVWHMGLNFGIDFQGGTLIEIKTKEPVANLGDIRSKVHGLGLGEVQVQEFGEPNDVMIRIAAQPTEKEQQDSIAKVKEALGADVEYRRVEVVGPTVSERIDRRRHRRRRRRHDRHPALYLVPLRMAVRRRGRRLARA